MKRLIFFLVLIFAVSLFAANTDRYYQGAVVKTESATEVIYTWTVTIGADSSDQLHSPPLKIADCNNAGTIRAVVNAASDVNVFYHYGSGYDWYAVVTATNLDATSTTAKYDPLTTALAFRCANYLVIETDSGSNATATGEIITITAVFDKDFEDANFTDVGFVVPNNESGWVNP